MGLEERDTTLLHIGKQCSHPSCLLVDFLPFPCDHCKSSFCQEHFTVTGHGCPEYDESKYNRVAPDCPFCKVPVAFPPGTDPNIKMEEHFVICPVYTGKELKKSVNRCSKPNCQKVMVVPISCENCRSKFCPSHRFPADHYCKGLTPSAAQPGRPNLLDRLSKQNVAATAATAASALSTIKNAVASTTASTPSSSRAVPRSEVAIAATARIGASNRKSGNAPKSVEKKEVVGSKSSASSSTSNPFSKVDRLSILMSTSPIPNDHAGATTANATLDTPTTNNDTDSTLIVAGAQIPKLFRLIDFTSFKPPSLFASA